MSMDISKRTDSGSPAAKSPDVREEIMPQDFESVFGPADTAEYQAAMLNEFPEGASEWTDPVSRRNFMGLMGASIALATGAGCYVRPAPPSKIVPYTIQPDQITPGVPLFFATAANLNGYGTGVLVRSNEGRPTKIEGNKEHPSSLGGVDILTQASVLDLYDPDRSRATLHLGQPTAYDNAVTALRQELYNVSGRELKDSPFTNKQIRIVTEPVTSPTLAEQIGEFLKVFPNARWVQHDTSPRDNLRAGIQKAFGAPLCITHDFKKADVILALDADFLCSGPAQVRYSQDFASRRRVRQDSQDGIKPEQMNRLYAIECMPTNTGAIADHRLALTVSQLESFACEVAKQLGVTGVPAAGNLSPEVEAWIKPLVEDLKSRAREGKGKTIVIAGDHLSPSLHALVFAINDKLGNFGQTIHQLAPIEARPDGKVQDLKTLTQEMNEGKVEVLLILGTNPAYTAPADLNFAKAARNKNIRFRLHLGTHADETSVLCEWHVPATHYLESWGDIRGHDGTITIQQPLIAPLTDGKSILEFLADVTQTPFRLGLDIVKDYWRKHYPGAKGNDTGEFEILWQEWVRAGVIKDSAAQPSTRGLDKNWASGFTTTPSLPAGQLELNYRLDPTLYDGRFANNGWLQELPKPLIIISWDNAVFVSPSTAAKLDVHRSFRWTGGEHGRAEVSVVELTVKDNGEERKVLAPVWILPGHADGAATVFLGSGRARAGRVATTPQEPNAEDQPVRGFNANLIRSSTSPWVASGLTITKTAHTYFLACVQGQWSSVQRDPTSGELMDRKPARHGTVQEYLNNPAFARIPPVGPGETGLINENVPALKKEQGEQKHDNEAGEEDKRLIPLTMYQPIESLSPDANEAQRHRWAMAIDLSVCTGCSSCMIACQSENNTPVVGKYEVTRGRIMHWIRIDRYYGGLQNTPNPDQTIFQPLACVQCETAPCEVVCPVGATVHSVDGLNDMVYNRCVGTRYCSNNCPYKVRRFNFLTYADWNTDTLKLQRNPDVSVRSRGVMEKCTFCVQRIRNAEIVAEREFRKIEDGEIMTACQSACPSGAIVFGDLQDPKSTVGRWKNEPTNYGLLAELNTKPRLTHLAALRNPNEHMPKGA